MSAAPSAGKRNSATFLVELFRQEVNTVFVGHGCSRRASIAKHNARDKSPVTQQATGTWRQTQRDIVIKRSLKNQLRTSEHCNDKIVWLPFLEGSEVALNSGRVLVRGSPGMSHLMRAQLGFFVRSETGTPHSDPFDELSARIFVRSDPRTPRNPMIGAKDSSDSIRTIQEIGTIILSRMGLSALKTRGARGLYVVLGVREDVLEVDADPPRQRRTRWLAGSASVKKKEGRVEVLRA